MSLGRDPRHLERSYYRRIELSILIAVAVHVAAMLLAPPYVARPYKLDETPLRLVMAAGGGTVLRGAPAAASEAAEPTSRSAARTRAPIVTREVRFSPQAQSVVSATAAAPEGSADRGAPGTPGGASAPGLEGSAPEVFYAFDSPPKVIRRVVPEYPAAAKAQGAEGTVVLNANVDERGRVNRVWVVQATAPEILIQAATDAMYRFEFAPGSSQGIPVKCTVAVPFNFHLNLHL